MTFEVVILDVVLTFDNVLTVDEIELTNGDVVTTALLLNLLANKLLIKVEVLVVGIGCVN